MSSEVMSATSGLTPIGKVPKDWDRKGYSVLSGLKVTALALASFDNAVR